MKTKSRAPLPARVFAAVLLAWLVVSGMKVKEPAGSGGTLLVGRIVLTCEGFPKGMNVNGDHSKNISLELKDSSNKFFSAVSRGEEGFFYFSDLPAGRYTLTGGKIELGNASTTIHLGFKLDDPVTVEAGSVNNLGDIAWMIAYESRSAEEYTESKVSSNLYVKNYLAYRGNHDEVKSWFARTFAKSAWNTREWVNVEMPRPR